MSGPDHTGAARKVTAEIAYQFAAMPDMARAMSAQFPNVAAYDEARVRTVFGPDAAAAWREVEAARKKFFMITTGEADDG